MSLQAHIRLVPPAAWPLGVGLLVTSSLFFGNIGLSLVGPMPIVKEEIGHSKLKSKDKVRIWTLFFDAATGYIVGGTVLTTALHIATAFITSSPLTRSLSIFSAISSISVLPYTVVFIMPTNNALKALDAKDELTASENAKVDGLLRDWDQKHKVRFIGYGLGWATGLASLFSVALGL